MGRDRSNLTRMRIALPLLVISCLLARAPVLAAPRDEAPPDAPDDDPATDPATLPAEPPDDPALEPPEDQPWPEEEPPSEEAFPPEEVPRVTPERPLPFPQGKVRLGIGGGLLGSRDSVDFGLEMGFGYFIFDNIEIGLDGAFQFGDGPFAAYLGPTARVLFPLNPAVALYIGGFYRHWFLTEGLVDFDTLGARGGVVVRTGGAYFSIGLVYETIVTVCEGECSDLYPELGVSVMF